MSVCIIDAEVEEIFFSTKYESLNEEINCSVSAHNSNAEIEIN
jgi:hypothetical protein